MSATRVLSIADDLMERRVLAPDTPREMDMMTAGLDGI